MAVSSETKLSNVARIPASHSRSRDGGKVNEDMLQHNGNTSEIGKRRRPNGAKPIPNIIVPPWRHSDSHGSHARVRYGREVSDDTLQNDGNPINLYQGQKSALCGDTHPNVHSSHTRVRERGKVRNDTL